MNDFNNYCLSRIKETKQMHVLKEGFVEIEPSSLYMGEIYNAVSAIVPYNYTIIDLGAYMGAQGFLFENHKEYIAVDSYPITNKAETDFESPKSFVIKNGKRYDGFIRDFLEGLKKDATFDPGTVYVVMNAVPICNETINNILSLFPNAAIAYPGTETIVQGILKKEVMSLTLALKKAKCPYAKHYLEKRPDVKAYYDKLYNELKSNLHNYAKNPIPFLKEEFLDLENVGKEDLER